MSDQPAYDVARRSYRVFSFRTQSVDVYVILERIENVFTVKVQFEIEVSKTIVDRPVVQYRDEQEFVVRDEAHDSARHAEREFLSTNAALTTAWRNKELLKVLGHAQSLARFIAKQEAVRSKANPARRDTIRPTLPPTPPVKEKKKGWLG